MDVIFFVICMASKGGEEVGFVVQGYGYSRCCMMTHLCEMMHQLVWWEGTIKAQTDCLNTERKKQPTLELSWQNLYWWMFRVVSKKIKASFYLSVLRNSELSLLANNKPKLTDNFFLYLAKQVQGPTRGFDLYWYSWFMYFFMGCASDPRILGSQLVWALFPFSEIYPFCFELQPCLE